MSRAIPRVSFSKVTNPNRALVVTASTGTLTGLAMPVP